MRSKLFILLIIAAVGWGIWHRWGNRAEFILGGAMVNIGYRLQDRLGDYDLAHHDASPTQVWQEFLEQNRLASSVRFYLPRSARHPVVALVACMDGRLDTNEIAGDTRRFYYVLRTAGSVLSAKEEEMLELTVANGVKVVVFTTHTDCAAEKAAKDPSKRALYPQLTAAVEERKARFEEFLSRPSIRERSAKGQLLVKWMDLNTATERIDEHPRNHPTVTEHLPPPARNLH
jgi:carbonic anhydrase